jgi:hypothetical protein
MLKFVTDLINNHRFNFLDKILVILIKNTGTPCIITAVVLASSSEGLGFESMRCQWHKERENSNKIIIIKYF